jgi:hypothetical protein
VEVQGVQQFHGGLRRVRGDIARHVEQAFRVVEEIGSVTFFMKPVDAEKFNTAVRDALNCV